jgi:hypothetical protein
MTENPYRLTRDVRGIGFKTADAIAMRLGVEKTAMIRLRAGVSFALAEAMDNGHCGLPTAELVPFAEGSWKRHSGGTHLWLTRSAQARLAEPEDALQVSEEHLDLLSLPARDDIGLGLGDGARLVAGGFMNGACDLARGHVRAAFWL